MKLLEKRRGPEEQVDRIRSRIQLGLMVSSCILEKDAPFSDTSLLSVGKLS